MYMYVCVYVLVCHTLLYVVCYVYSPHCSDCCHYVHDLYNPVAQDGLLRASELLV